MSWKSILATVAPTIATALGGPLAGMAAKAALSGLGITGFEKVSKSQALKMLEREIENNPDALLKLREIDNTFKVRMEELGVDLEEIAVKDRAGARKMATDTTLLPQMVLATIYVISFAAILIAVLTGEVKLEGAQLTMANMLIGILSYGLAQIMNFFFGSSAGSKQKTAQLGGG